MAHGGNGKGGRRAIGVREGWLDGRMKEIE